MSVCVCFLFICFLLCFKMFFCSFLRFDFAWRSTFFASAKVVFFYLKFLFVSFEMCLIV